MYSDSGVDPTKDAVFTDFMEQWLELRKALLAPTTYDAYRITLDNHILPYFKPKNLSVAKITPIVVQKYVSEKLKDVSANTVRKHLANISSCMDSAVKQDIIKFNPVNRIEKPKKVKFTGAQYYNEGEIAQLLECAKGDPLEIVIKLTLFYGLRRSEVLGLMWSAVDFEAKTIAIRHTVVKIGNVTHKYDRTKNECSNTIFHMPEFIIAELRLWKERQDELKVLQPNDYQDTGYICTYHDGRLFATDFVSQHFARLLKKKGMRHIRFHDLRHSSANYLSYLGLSHKHIQTWLRHTDIETTLGIYVSFGMEEKANIANILDERFQAMTALQ
jgi:integrase